VEGVSTTRYYNDNDNIASQTYHHRNQQTPPSNGFTYDDLNRLTIAGYQAGLTGDETFNYDLLGNRDSTTDSRTGGARFGLRFQQNINKGSIVNKGSRNRFRPFPASFRPSRRLRPQTRFPFAFGPRWQVSHSKKTAQNI
jgi:hypothetical protein